MSDIQLHAWLFSNPWGKVFFHLKSMGQICPLDLIFLMTFPHQLENNHACKWISENFPGIKHMLAFLENSHIEWFTTYILKEKEKDETDYISGWLL